MYVNKSEYGCDGCRKGFQWSSVAGVQDALGLVVGVEGKLCRLSFRSDHSRPIPPLPPMCCGSDAPSGRSVAGASSRPERRRASVS